MTDIIFVGPTLSAKEVARHPDVMIMPPVQQGDVYRAVRSKPRAIGIIDGFFEGVPSVWHKEILWAIQQGIPVYGSASMGALRAAELADFGMIGVGRIYQDYLDGTLQDDDEVAVLHSPAELGFQPLSEPMVSIRATVERAVDDNVLPPDTATQMLRVAKEMHYHTRLWPRICEAMNSHPGLSKFTDWLPDGRVDAKADDAREMLALMAQQGRPEQMNGTPVRVEPTLAWRDLCARINSEPDPGNPDDRGAIDELRLMPELYIRLRDQALLSLLATEDTKRRNHHPNRDDLVRQMSDHRLQAGLSKRADLMRWLDENGLDPQSYEELLTDQSRLKAALAARTGVLNAPLLAALRHSGDYPALRDRAAQKAETLKNRNASNRPSADRLQVLMWYFETHLDQEVPDDLESYAVSLGLAGRDEFYELIEAEFLFRQSNGKPTGP